MVAGIFTYFRNSSCSNCIKRNEISLRGTRQGKENFGYHSFTNTHLMKAAKL